jgi:hypothetical protein
MCPDINTEVPVHHVIMSLTGFSFLVARRKHVIKCVS